MIFGSLLASAALAGFLLTDSVIFIFGLAMVYNVGQQARLVVASPFMTEHAAPERRDHLFALQFAIVNATQVVAALVGGALAAVLVVGGADGSPDTYRVLMALMLGLMLVAAVFAALLDDDRDALHRGGLPGASAEPGIARLAPSRTRARLDRLGVRIGDPGLFVRLVLPGFIISLGAGQVLPFLNLYIVGRFNLDLSETNLMFALTAFGTMVAILIQPYLARRFGRIASVVIVQAASIPFLFVLGFAPLIWMVVIAMAVRNSLMNAGNPIFNAFMMDAVRPIGARHAGGHGDPVVVVWLGHRRRLLRSRPSDIWLCPRL